MGDTEDKWRAGRYIKQLTGYRAFIPAPLPPDPGIEMTSGLWEALSKADRALGRLDGSATTLPDPDLFVFMYVRKEAVLSSQIEGTQASLADLLEFESRQEAGQGIKDVAEVANYIAAMNLGLERLHDLPLSLRLIREIHARLMTGVRGHNRTPGEFRVTQNWIGPAGCTLSNARFVPPPPEIMLEMLGNLENFFYDERPMPLLIRVGLAHAQFETLHPFLDGNGRVGRLLITFLLCQAGVLQRPLLYLSHYFKLHRAEYYDRLQAIRDDGEWEGWLRFFLDGVYQVSQEATETARKVVAMREEHRKQIGDHLGRSAGKALALHESLFKHPYMTVQQMTEVMGLSYSNANHLVGQIEAIGLLKEVTGQRRNRIYGYVPYLQLFADGDEGSPAE
jgi:Fic family protein